MQKLLLMIILTLGLTCLNAKVVTLNFAHIGDLHGHLIPRDHVIVGDSHVKQGGAEVLYTRGQAILTVLNVFGIDYGTLGNWDHLYGEARTAEIFFNKDKLANWTSLTSNLYSKKTNALLSKPYQIFTRKGVKVDIIGFTSERPAMAVGPTKAIPGVDFIFSSDIRLK